MIHRSPVWVRLFIHFKPVSSSAVTDISHRLLHSCEETFCYYALGQTDCVSLQSANPIAYSPVPFMPTEESLQNVLLAVWALGLVLIWWQILFFFFFSPFPFPIWSNCLLVRGHMAIAPFLPQGPIILPCSHSSCSCQIATSSTAVGEGALSLIYRTSGN